MVVFHGRVYAGASVAKTHTTDPDAFSAPHTGPIGRMDPAGVVYDRAPVPSPRLAPRQLGARVALVPMVVGDDGGMLDAARASHDGVVIEAFGSGNVPPGAVPAIGRWLAERKPVVLASRCLYGQVQPTYAFDGGGARTTAMGAIPAGPRTPSQARMELTIALSAGAPYGA
jgi:L-asparaginase